MGWREDRSRLKNPLSRKNRVGRNAPPILTHKPLESVALRSDFRADRPPFSHLPCVFLPSLRAERWEGVNLARGMSAEQRVAPNRRVGVRRLSWALYGAKYICRGSYRLKVQSARPRGRLGRARPTSSLRLGLVFTTLAVLTAYFQGDKWTVGSVCWVRHVTKSLFEISRAYLAQPSRITEILHKTLPPKSINTGRLELFQRFVIFASIGLNPNPI